MKNNNYRYCPDKKGQVNKVRCCACIFSQGITGNTNLFKLQCYFKYCNKKYKKEIDYVKSKTI